MYTLAKQLKLLLLCCGLTRAQKDPNFIEGKTTIVHLFEWKWNDIAAECEGFLKEKGFGGVQISPPHENIVLPNRPWYERYQPVSYTLTSRSGDELDFADMVSRCNAVGVRIYVDIVMNHMTAANGTGIAGNFADRDNENYPAVPYDSNDFNENCTLDNYQNATIVRNCQLVGLADLDQSNQHVREKLVEYMNRLIDFGVAGFRIDLAKNMWPADLKEIYASIKDLNIAHGFRANSRPFIYQEVADLGEDAISKHEYNDFAAVLEFQYGASLGSVFQGGNMLSALEDWGPNWNLLNSSDAVAFIDNHDNQRAGGDGILTYKKPKPYKMAIAFMQAHPYGTTRVISSFAFETYDQGPPQDSDENLISPSFNADGTCGNGYVCEHRWRQIYNMVGFRNTVAGTGIENWWTNYDQQIAFSRGNKGFVAFTQEGDIHDFIQTSLPSGIYCDVISGELLYGLCTGKIVIVGFDGKALVSLSQFEEDGVLAIHVNAKLL